MPELQPSAMHTGYCQDCGVHAQLRWESDDQQLLCHDCYYSIATCSECSEQKPRNQLALVGRLFLCVPCYDHRSGLVMLDRVVEREQEAKTVVDLPDHLYDNGHW